MGEGLDELMMQLRLYPYWTAGVGGSAVLSTITLFAGMAGALEPNPIFLAPAAVFLMSVYGATKETARKYAEVCLDIHKRGLDVVVRDQGNRPFAEIYMKRKGALPEYRESVERVDYWRTHESLR